MTDYRTLPRKTNESALARLRMERGLTQGQLAEKAGCYPKDISRWETGVRKPGTVSLRKLAAALECSFDELLK